MALASKNAETATITTSKCATMVIKRTEMVVLLNASLKIGTTVVGASKALAINVSTKKQNS